MTQSEIKPRKDQDLPDSALSVIDMLEGKLMEYNSSPTREGIHERKEELATYEDLFKQLEHQSEIAKQIVMLEGFQNILNQVATSSEQKLIQQVNLLLAKSTALIKTEDTDLTDVKKTNLPPIEPQEDSVSELSDEERKTEDKEV